MLVLLKVGFVYKAMMFVVLILGLTKAPFGGHVLFVLPKVFGERHGNTMGLKPRGVLKRTFFLGLSVCFA